MMAILKKAVLLSVMCCLVLMCTTACSLLENEEESSKSSQGNLVDCTRCGGTGFDCLNCTDGYCPYCGGDGVPTCLMCKDSKVCGYCDGTKVNYSGDPCRQCGADGICPDCENGYSVQCYGCRGSGVCFLCDGERICQGCNGKGKVAAAQNPDQNQDELLPYIPNPDDDFCDYCANLKTMLCDKCFNGKCLECGGDGYRPVYSGLDVRYVDCAYCMGGTCTKCYGSGELDCPYCY